MKPWFFGLTQGEKGEEKVNTRGDSTFVAKGDEANEVDVGVRHQLCEPDFDKTKKSGDEFMEGESYPIPQSIEWNGEPAVGAPVHFFVEVRRPKVVLIWD